MTSISLLALTPGCSRPLPDLDDAHRDLSAALPVFPGAEGFGTDTPAGRGGEIVLVQNLQADGPGSLQAALDRQGPRTILFEVAGVIELVEPIRVDQPFVTIAGQTAPSPGITLSGAGLLVSTHDVLVQHIHVRPGDASRGPEPQKRDGLSVYGAKDGETDVFGVVFDHCSVSWAVDENGDTFYAGVRDITFSNSLFTEGLWNSLHAEQPHSKGLLVGTHSRRVAVIRNIFAHNHDRNPVVTADASALVVNNFVYDPGLFAMVMYNGQGWGPSLATFDGNRVVDGVATEPDTPALHLTDTISRASAVFAADNGRVVDELGVLTSTRPVTVKPLTVLPADEVEAYVLEHAGARPWDRDTVDARVTAEIVAREGGPVDSPAEVGGQPSTQAEQALTLPDDPLGDPDGDGYTNLEEWLHDLGSQPPP
jgi:hypothetical protein